MPPHPHTFHIPVMGTGFSIDTPLRVARYGISSVISLVDDALIEQVRKFHCQRCGEPYEPIKTGLDKRAKRITAYLNFIDRKVRRQIETLKAEPFGEGSSIDRYFELLPASKLKEDYSRMLSERDSAVKTDLQDSLRKQIVAGSIDVNIMTKLDSGRYYNGEELPAEYADAMQALRGFARSDLSSGIVFSAGINQRLYRYAAQFDDFFEDEQGELRKKIIVKVSDYRSALIQGKFLAKRGLWVSEFRIESGLNCGGHAFASGCSLMGPVLEQFKQNRHVLRECLHNVYTRALEEMGRPTTVQPLKIRITAQGGIGTSHENHFLLQYYHINGTGWGTPFMLVPEVTNVDPAHLDKLCNAADDDVYLSNSSPLGVRFWNLRTSASEEMRRKRIDQGNPGSPCPKGLCLLNQDFPGKPLCVASRSYTKQKLAQLAAEDATNKQAALLKERVLEKSCLCHDLAGAVSLNHDTDQKATPAICCGPNIRNFNRIFSMEEMIDHIYGRLSLVFKSERPHMFIEEMRLNLDYLKEEIALFSQRISNRQAGFFDSFKNKLLEGIDYYRDLTKQFIEEQRERFLEDLKKLQEEIEHTCLPEGDAPCP